MKRAKFSFIPTELTALDLDSLGDTLPGEEPIRTQKMHIRRWRRLKQQLV